MPPNKKNTLELLTPSRTYVVCSKNSNDEVLAWMKAIQQQITETLETHFQKESNAKSKKNLSQSQKQNNNSIENSRNRSSAANLRVSTDANNNNCSKDTSGIKGSSNEVAANSSNHSVTDNNLNATNSNDRVSLSDKRNLSQLFVSYFSGNHIFHSSLAKQNIGESPPSPTQVRPTHPKLKVLLDLPENSVCAECNTRGDKILKIFFFFFFLTKISISISSLILRSIIYLTQIRNGHQSIWEFSFALSVLEFIDRLEYIYRRSKIKNKRIHIFIYFPRRLDLRFSEIISGSVSGS